MLNKLIALSLLALLSACGAGDKPAATAAAPAAASAPPPPEVEVLTIVAGDATFTQDLPGRVQAFRTAQVRARVDGVVEARLFKEGSQVKANSRLFRIDSRSYQATADAARADAALAKETVERLKRLREINGVSQQDLDIAQNKAKQTAATLIKAEEDLANAHVPAPLSGFIGRSQVTEGALVNKSTATLLATIEQLDPVYVNFTQSSAELSSLRHAVSTGVLKNANGAKVELLLEDGSIYPQAGKLSFSDLAVDPSTGSVSLRAEFPNAKRDLLPGMFVRIRFPQAIAENAIRVPQRAVQSNTSGQFVMVVGADGKANPQPIKTGGMASTDFVILSGLKGGEQVIVNGLQKARPGIVVKAVPLVETMKLDKQLTAPAPSK
ncbi:MAG: efflux RND transporter periplasmic adaptor subunit [Sideroxydans sp.]|nr:efflux RND transporter periplasmic adaptor subunit [Sideroxydans sp.]